MDRISVAGAVVALFSSVCGAQTSAQLEARVRETAGGPQIFVNGEAVPPRMFFGKPGAGLRMLDGDRWTPFAFEFSVPTACDRVSIHVRFHRITGGVTRLRNFRVRVDGTDVLPGETAFDADEAFDSVWNVWPRTRDYARTCRDGVCEVRFTPLRPEAEKADYHFYTKYFGMAAGARCRFEFEAQGLDGCAWIRPAAYSVAPDGKHTSLVLNGVDALTATVAKAAAVGVDFVSYDIPDVWKEAGDDFIELDALTDRILAVNPKARLIPRVSVNAPLWWLRANPDHRMQFAAEHVGNAPQQSWGRGLRPDMAAVSSRLYQQAALDYVTRFARHMMARYPANFAGIHPTGQNTHEWFYLDSWNKMNGYDPQTRDAFRAYLDDPNAEVPTVAERYALSRSQRLLDGETQKKCLAFNRFQQLEMTDFLTRLAQACRAATEGKKLVVLFYGYSYEFSSHRCGPANSGHYGVENLLRKSDGAIDILCSPVSYRDRAWCGSAPNMSCGETIMRHGILWLNEDDSRTYLDHRTAAYVHEGSLVTREQSRQVMLRNTAQAAIHGFGTWWMDLPGYGWYDAKKLWDVQAALNPLDRRLCRRVRPYEPQVALIQDEESMLHLLPDSAAVCEKLVSWARKAVSRAGVSYGQYLLFDVLERPLAARLQVYQSCWCLSDAEVEKLVAAKKTNPSWRVWCWAAGAQNEAGAVDLARMSRLNGFQMAARDMTHDSWTLARATPVGLSNGLKKDWWYGTKGETGLTFYAADAKPEEVWATYPDGHAALAVRADAFGGGDIFLGVPELASEMAHAFASVAGVPCYLSREDVGKACVWATGGTNANADVGVFAIQAMQDAKIRLRFPVWGDVRDALTGETVGSGPVLPLDLRQGEVRVLTGLAEKPPLKMLMIGNSFSISCLTYLPQVAADCGKVLDLASLCIGGCSLERHGTNIAKEKKGLPGAYQYDRQVGTGPRRTMRAARLTDVLKEDRWDVVTIQQASHLSWQKDSYHPWGDELVKTVRDCAPQAKIVVQETWSYTPFADRLASWKMSADEMYDRLATAYADFADAMGFDLIRMGRAVQEWRRRLPVVYGEHSFGGDVVGGRWQNPGAHFRRNPDSTWSLTSDPFHLNEKGEYLQALVWAAKLLDADLANLKTHPDCVTDEEARLMRQIAEEVRRGPGPFAGDEGNERTVCRETDGWARVTVLFRSPFPTTVEVSVNGRWAGSVAVPASSSAPEIPVSFDALFNRGPNRVRFSCGRLPEVVTFMVSDPVKATGLETELWQRRINAVAARGGGRVTIPAGRHRVGGLELRSNVELHLEDGAVLEGVYGLENYRIWALPFSEGTWSAIVAGVGVTNVAVTGAGEIFGNGGAWPLPSTPGANQEGLRARGLFFANAKDVRLEDFSLRDAACWGIVLKCVDGVVARRVKIDNHANYNNDGFDVEARNAVFESCDVDASDDAFVLKSNDARFVVENVLITNCIARSHCYAYKLGTASHGTMRNVSVVDSKALPPRRDFLVGDSPGPHNGKKGQPFWASRMGYDRYPAGCGAGSLAVECVDGGAVEDVLFENIEVSGATVPIFVRGGTRKGRSNGIRPGSRHVLRNITFRNVRGEAAGWIASSVTGVKGCRVANVTLENVDIRCRGAGVEQSRKALRQPVPDVSGGYPCVMMFGHILPAYGLYVDQADNLTLTNVTFRLFEGEADLRPSIAGASFHP